MKPFFRHEVQFYKNSDSLCRSVAATLERALLSGNVAVVVATEPHRRAFQSALSASVHPQVLAERFVVRDAQQTLSRFLVNGEPDWPLFKDVVGELVAEASRQQGRKVQVYGEMVNLLWQQGKVSQALALESFWNNLGSLYPFTLLCSYHLPSVDGPARAVRCERPRAGFRCAPRRLRFARQSPR